MSGIEYERTRPQVGALLIMLNRVQVWWSSVTLIGLLFSACAPVPRAVPFNEAEFGRYPKSGTGVVTGRAYMELRDKTIRVADKTAIDLEPVTRYTTEARNRKWISGENLEPSDARLSNYIREVVSDDNGYFAFTHVPPGDYYVVFHALWRQEHTAAEADQPFTDHLQWIFTRVTIRNDSRINVSDWEEGYFEVH